MLKRLVSTYFTCVMLLVIFLIGIVLFDYLSYVHNGEYSLFLELNLARYKVADTPNGELQEAQEYLESLFARGYSHHDLLHLFANTTLIVASISSVIALCIWLFFRHILSKNAKITSLVFSAGTLFVVLLLRIFVQGTYAIAEVKLLYPIACFLLF